MPAPAPAPAPDTYLSAAQKGFVVLYRLWADGYNYQSDTYHGTTFKSDFWFAGNTLRTCIDYRLAVKDEAAAAEVLHAGCRIYLTLKDNPGWWKDDYGWWGNAFATAYDNRTNLKLEGNRYDALFANIQQYTLDCWKELNGNWRDTAYNHLLPNFPGERSDNAAGGAEIAIDGGVFNTTPDGWDSSGLSGRNCVTNEGFWILSGHVERYFPNDAGVKAKKGQPKKWFDQWLNKEGTLLNKQGLVLERPAGNQAVSSWYWLGDQGLFIEALSAADPAGYADRIKKIATAVTKSSILHENMEFVSKHGGYVADYATGKGILMRSLAALNLKTKDKPYSDFLKRNAAAVWSSRDAASNQFMFNWESPPVQGKNRGC